MDYSPSLSCCKTKEIAWAGGVCYMFSQWQAWCGDICRCRLLFIDLLKPLSLPKAILSLYFGVSDLGGPFGVVTFSETSRGMGNT